MSPRDLKRRREERLKDPEVRRWHENITRGSETTAETYLRALFLFCDLMHTSPPQLWKLREEKLHRMLLDFVSLQEKRGQTGQTTTNIVKSVRSWLLHGGKVLTRPIKIYKSQDPPSIRDERIPTQEELHRILLSCTSCHRVSAVLVAHAGLRPEVLGNYYGTDGLRLKDFPELRIKGNGIEFTRVPAMVVVRPELSKSNHRYFSFVGAEGCGYIRDYLQERAEFGEQLTPETGLVKPRNLDKSFIRTTNIGDGIRAGIRAVVGREVKMRPYALRAYFDTQLLLAESKGKVAHDYRVFWMGHRGSMEARYTTNKGRLPQKFLDDMRDAYHRCQPFLATTPMTDAAEVDAAVNRQFLRLSGYTDDEINEMDLTDTEKVRELAREGLARGSGGPVEDAPQRPAHPALSGYQIVVQPAAVAGLVAHGWRELDRLGPDQVLMVSPASPGTSTTPSSSAPARPAGAGPAPPATRAAAGDAAGGARPPASSPSSPPPRKSSAGRERPRWKGEVEERVHLSTPVDGPDGPGRP